MQPLCRYNMRSVHLVIISCEPHLQMKLSLKSSFLTCCFKRRSTITAAYEGNSTVASWSSMKTYNWAPKARAVLLGPDGMASFPIPIPIPAPVISPSPEPPCPCPCPCPCPYPSPHPPLFSKILIPWIYPWSFRVPHPHQWLPERALMKSS